MFKSKSPKDTKGPVVKTGPTKGQNRSRTKDGAWRAKRSDAGKSRSKDSGGGGKKGCFITTAACEFKGLSDDCYELQVLRNFRDEVLTAMPDGAAMVSAYYQIAPDLVPLLKDEIIAERTWRQIRITVSQIQSKQHVEAVKTYQGLVKSLQKIS